MTHLITTLLYDPKGTPSPQLILDDTVSLYNSLSPSLGGCAYAPFWSCRGDVYRVFGSGLVRGTGLAIRHHSGYYHDIFTAYDTPS